MLATTYKAALALLTLALAAAAAPVPDGPVFTATRIYHTIIDEPPYLVDRTTTIVWTQGPSITSLPHQTARAV